MKLIFLDMDGVMNSLQSIHFFLEFMKLPNNWFKKYMPDGTEDFHIYENEICPMAVSNMAILLKKYPDTRFVMSSTWRISRDEKWFEELFRYIGMIGDKGCSACDGTGEYSDNSICENCNGEGLWKDPNINTKMVIGRTPRLGTERGLEIQKWIDDNQKIMKNVDEFVILDDDSDMCHFIGTKHFIHTDSAVGFDYNKMKEVDKIFGRFNLKYRDLKVGALYKMFGKSRETLYQKDIEGKIFYINREGEVRDGVSFHENSSLFAKVK